MSGVNILKILNAIRIITIDGYERTIISAWHGKPTISLAGSHLSLYCIGGFNIEYILELSGIIKVSILFGQDMEQLIWRLEIIGDDL